MADWTQASFFEGLRSSAAHELSPVRYPPPYEITTDLRKYWAYFDTDCFVRLPSDGAVLAALFGVGVGGTAPGA